MAEAGRGSRPASYVEVSWDAAGEPVGPGVPSPPRGPDGLGYQRAGPGLGCPAPRPDRDGLMTVQGVKGFDCLSRLCVKASNATQA